MVNALKFAVAVASGTALAVVAGVMAHVLTQGSDSVAYIAAGLALIAAFSSIRPATK